MNAKEVKGFRVGVASERTMYKILVTAEELKGGARRQ